MTGLSMNDSFYIDHDNGITRITFNRSPNEEELLGLIDELSTHWPYARRLYDLREHGLTLNGTNMRKLAEYGKKKFPLPNRLAIVAGEDLSFGLARMFEVYREEEKVTSWVFRDYDEATAWLLDELPPLESGHSIGQDSHP